MKNAAKVMIILVVLIILSPTIVYAESFQLPIPKVGIEVGEAETPEDYVDLIEKALKENSKELEEKRRIYGLSHSWENNVNEIYNCILKVKKVSA